jgi:DNA primase
MLSTDAKKSLKEAAETYYNQVVDIQDYLLGRGIDGYATRTHRLGYVKDPVIGHEAYKGRLSIPYLTPSGLADLRFRSINPDDSPKYLSRPGAEQHIYNVLAFQEDSDIICICEGEIDTIIMHSMVKIPAVGMPGSNGWKNWYARAFSDYRKVLVLTDGDSSGHEMGKKIMQAIDVAVIVSMPDGMDVNEVFLAEGEEGMRKRVGL